jgi:hypothetical protein
MPRPRAFLTGSVPRARQTVLRFEPGDLLVRVFIEEVEETRPSEPVPYRGGGHGRSRAFRRSRHHASLWADSWGRTVCRQATTNPITPSRKTAHHGAPAIHSPPSPTTAARLRNSFTGMTSTLVDSR